MTEQTRGEVLGLREHQEIRFEVIRLARAVIIAAIVVIVVA